MAGKPYIDLYPGDFIRDNVAGCSLAAQGLWLRMLFVMHDAPQRGYLALNGQPMDDAYVARRCGATPGEYAELLAELKAAEVPGMTENGIIFSRRMARDEQKSKTAAENGGKGGKKTQEKRRKEKDQADAEARRKRTTKQTPKQKRSKELTKTESKNEAPRARARSVSSSVSVSNQLSTSVSPGGDNASRAPEPDAPPNISPIGSEKDNSNGAYDRRPDDPPDGIRAEDWKRACHCADLVEGAESPVEVVDPGGLERGLAFHSLWDLRKGRGSKDAWKEITSAIATGCQIAAECEEAAKIIGDLRRYPDGAYPHTGERNGQTPSRVEKLARITKKHVLGLSAK